MKWLLVIYFLNTGLYQEPHLSAIDCNDALIEASLVKGNDLWSAVCIGPDDEVTSQTSTDMGP